jgi:hypothetical protein
VQFIRIGRIEAEAAKVLLDEVLGATVLLLGRRGALADRLNVCRSNNRLSG